ncbi:MAG: apolipoprotein N-acyltransferase [Mariprofundaceae bacterium]
MTKKYLLFKNASLAFVSGACMQFSFSPFDYAWLAIILIACWAWLLQQHCHTAYSSFWISYGFGVGWFGVGAWWLADTFYTYGHLPWAVSFLCVALIGLIMGLFPAIWGWISWKIAHRSHYFMMVFAAAGVCLEWLRGHLFTGLPWSAIGNLLLDTPAVGWGAVVGVYGAAFLPLLTAASLAMMINAETRRSGATGIAIAAILLISAPSPWQANGVTGKVALIQANIPQDKKWDATFLHETMQRYTALSQQAVNQVDLIIWPEAAIPFFLSDAPSWDQWLSEKMKVWQRPVLFGGIKRLDVKETRMAANGLFLFDPDTDERQFTGKHHLVPFGEYVPAWIPFLRKLVPDIGDFRATDDHGLLTLKGKTFGSLICYESIFPEEARSRSLYGAELLVAAVNDAWYGKTPAAGQHLQAARMRAVENGRYLLRAANTGISAVIAPDGTMTATMPWWKQGVVYGDYQYSSVITPYLRWGDTPLLLFPVLLLIMHAMRRR